MQREILSFPTSNVNVFKQKVLAFAARFDVCCSLDSNHYDDRYRSFESITAIGAEYIFSPEKNILPQFKQFLSQHNDWLFGHVNYDLKNEIEPSLTSSHKDGIGFPEMFFFQPKIIVECKKEEVVISSLNFSPGEIFNEINNIEISEKKKEHFAIEIKPRISKADYLSVIGKLQQHILKGDCYEINYCMEFFSENTVIDPVLIYQRLSAVSPSPFSAFYKVHDKYLCSASPERYLKKQHNKIIAQPIKGTAKRFLNDIEKDILSKEKLMKSEKDRSENVMIVDLMRNDLSKICREDSVKVNELFGVYSFAQVHQMISTVEGELNAGTDLSDILKAAFPMGSMTGAPKKKVIELIEKYEVSKRGIYSGCVGYISPEKDFDLNVVIRGIMYNAEKKFLSYQAGGAITFYSNAEEEYEECLIKASAMEKALL